MRQHHKNIGMNGFVTPLKQSNGNDSVVDTFLTKRRSIQEPQTPLNGASITNNTRSPNTSRFLNTFPTPFQDFASSTPANTSVRAVENLTRPDVPISRLATTPIRPLMESPFKPPASTFARPTTPVQDSSYLSQDQLIANSVFGKSFIRTPGLRSPNVSLMSPVQRSPEHPVQQQTIPEQDRPITITQQDEWQVAVVQQAMSRMVNNDVEVKKLLTNVVIWLVLRFVMAVARLIHNLDPEFVISLISVVGVSELQLVSSLGYLLIALQLLFFYNITTATIRLVRPVDACLDLNLSKKQRKLLGLPLVEEVLDDEDYQRWQRREVKQEPEPERRFDFNSTATMTSTLASLDLKSPPKTTPKTRIEHVGTPDSLRRKILENNKNKATESPNPPAASSSGSRSFSPSSKFVYAVTHDASRDYDQSFY